MHKLHPVSVSSMRFWLRWMAWSLPIGTGVVLGVSFPPMGGAGIGIGLIALVPLLVRWLEGGLPTRVLHEVALAGGIAGAVAFGWGVWHPFWPSAAAAVGGIGLWAFGFALPWMAGAVWVRRNQLGRAWLVVIGGTLVLEGLWSIGPWALPWGGLGHTLASVPVLSSLAAAWGVPGLSLLVLVANAWVAESVYALRVHRSSGRSRTPHDRRRWAVLLLCVMGLVGHAVWLDRVHSVVSEPPPDAPVLFLVQPGHTPTDWATLDDPKRVRDLQVLTIAALDTARRFPDMVVWPETAVPPDPSDTLRTHLQRWVEQHNVPLLTGAIAHVPTARPYRHANRLTLFQPHATRQTYDKHHLVPFVEGVPGAEALPFVAHGAVAGGGVAGYQRGPGPTLLSVRRPRSRDTLRLAPLICLESVIGPYVQRYMAARRWPEALVVASQTGWWGTPRPARQHLAFSRLRTLETGRPLALVTVAGPTTAVAPDGTVGRRLPWGERGVVAVRLPSPASRPPYATQPPGLLPLFGMVALALAWIPCACLRN